MPPSLRFCVLFVLQYARFMFNCVARARYQPCDRPERPRHRPSNVVGYIPSVDCAGAEFERTVQCAVQTGCRAVYSQRSNALHHTHAPSAALWAVLAAVRPPNKRERTRAALQQIAREMEDEAATGPTADERIQLLLGLDDHAWMNEPREFLADLVAPFENPTVGGVVVGKQVERLANPPPRPSRSLLNPNLLGCFYLLCHNWSKC